MLHAQQLSWASAQIQALSVGYDIHMVLKLTQRVESSLVHEYWFHKTLAPTSIKVWNILSTTLSAKEESNFCSIQHMGFYSRSCNMPTCERLSKKVFKEWLYNFWGVGETKTRWLTQPITPIQKHGLPWTSIAGSSQLVTLFWRESWDAMQSDSKSYLPDSGCCSGERCNAETHSRSVEDKRQLHRCHPCQCLVHLACSKTAIYQLRSCCSL